MSLLILLSLLLLLLLWNPDDNSVDGGWSQPNWIWRYFGQQREEKRKKPRSRTPAEERPTKLGTNAAADNSSDIVYGSMLEFVFLRRWFAKKELFWMRVFYWLS